MKNWTQRKYYGFWAINGAALLITLNPVQGRTQSVLDGANQQAIDAAGERAKYIACAGLHGGDLPPATPDREATVSALAICDSYVSNYHHILAVMGFPPEEVAAAVAAATADAQRAAAKALADKRLVIKQMQQSNK